MEKKTHKTERITWMMAQVAAKGGANNFEIEIEERSFKWNFIH